MRVLENREYGTFAPQSSGRDDRDFSFEIDECFVDSFAPMEARPAALQIGLRLKFHLAFTIVPETRRLQNTGQSNLARSGFQSCQRTNAAKRCDRKSVLLEKRLLP